MRILYICDQSPFEHYNGSQQRNRLLLDSLCLKSQVDLVCFTSDPYPQSLSNPECCIRYFEELPEVRQSKIVKRLAKLVNIFHSLSPYSVYGKNKVACEIVQRLLSSNEYNYIVIRYIKNAFICGLFNDKRIIVDIDDLPEQTILSYLEISRLPWFRSIQYRFYAFRSKFHTNRFVKKIHHAFCSNKFQNVWENSSYLPNIPFPYNKLKINPDELNHQPDNYYVLFVGYMIHTPNLNGVQSFLDNIWGYIKEAVPSAVFKIAGKGVSAEQKIIWEKHEGVQVLGFVSDIYYEYRKCNVAVAPISYGAGTNIKVLEAMSMSRACVITDFVGRAFKNDLINNSNILVAINNKDFAENVIKLLLDKNLNKYIASNGAKLIEEKYSYSVFLNSVNQVII